MTIKVENQSSFDDIEVAINYWGGNAETDYFPLKSGKEEQWDRIDKRGFVMCVKLQSIMQPYYVMTDNNYAIQKAESGGFKVYNTGTRQEVKMIKVY